MINMVKKSNEVLKKRTKDMDLSQFLAFFKDNMYANIEGIQRLILGSNVALVDLVDFNFQNWLEQFEGYIRELLRRIDNE